MRPIHDDTEQEDSLGIFVLESSSDENGVLDGAGGVVDEFTSTHRGQKDNSTTARQHQLKKSSKHWDTMSLGEGAVDQVDLRPRKQPRSTHQHNSESPLPPSL